MRGRPFVAGTNAPVDAGRAGAKVSAELRRQGKYSPEPYRQGAAIARRNITPESRQRAGAKGIGSWSLDERAEYQKRSAEARGSYPMPIPTQLPLVREGASFKSFAQKIRHKTKDGWELVDAVYEVFCRAREAHADQIIMDSATWLADRGFGKPVQVGQLLDGEGNPVAFTLWSPATQEPIGDVITIQNGKVVPEDSTPSGEDPLVNEYQPRPELLEAPKPYEPPKKDGYADGVARAWGKDQESRKGE